MTLLNLDRYMRFTQEDTVPGDLDQALVDAQTLVEEYLQRPLESASRTERMKLYPDGRVYPKATPITVVPSGMTIDGDSIIGATTDDVPFWNYIDSAFPPYATVIYTGGWTDETLPVSLGRGIAMVALDLLRSGAVALLASLPAGATSVSLGDASIGWGGQSGAGGHSAWIPDSAAVLLAPYRRRVV